MSKIVRLALLTALLVGIATVGLASAQSGVTYTSGFQVQNLENTDATVQLEFYNQNGSLAVNPAPTYTIPANSSKTFFPINDISSGFNGSLVILSDKEVRAVNNLVGSGPANYFAATNGFQAGSTTVNLPLVMCNNSNFNTFFNVQNAGDADANITITYYPGSDGTAGISENAMIPRGAAKTFDQTEGSTTANCATLKGPSGKFIGSATITSNQPIVASLMQLNTVNFRVLMGYGGFTAGSPTVALPLVMGNNAGFYTGIQVQNTGAAATDVTITYAANTAGANTPQPEVFNLAPGASKTIIQSGTPAQGGSAVNDWTTLGRYIGSATITNSGGQPLVAIVNQVRPNPALGTAYEGFNPAAATTKISAALIMSNNSSYYTGIQVQNVTGGPVDVTIDYGPNTAGTFNPVNETFTLPAGASKTIIQNSTTPANGSVQNWTEKYIGSATITATGNVVAIVNQVSLSLSGDQFATSNAFNY
jgi:hypothetical protein